MVSLKVYFSTIFIKIFQKFGPPSVEVLGRKFLIGPEVFNPRFFSTSRIFARNINLKGSDSVLDLGTGSGIHAIIAADTAKSVVAIDINHSAVKCAKENVILCEKEDRIEVLQGDLFGPLKKEKIFDVIFFNPPYLDGKLNEPFSHALYDPNKNLMKRFFSEARDYLKSEGYIMLIYSSLGEFDKLLSMAEKFGWKHEVLAKKKAIFEEYVVYKFY